jgi:tight adherence protein C
MGLLAGKTAGDNIVITPPALKVLQDIRLQMQAGKSLQFSIQWAASLSKDPFRRAILTWIARLESGQGSAFILMVLPELNSTAARRALIIILEKGLKGAPIDAYLAELEDEMFQIAEQTYEKHLQILPLKLMAPLIFFIMPSVLLLLLGPLLFTINRGF